jgi:RsmE family RNA methyltransferase
MNIILLEQSDIVAEGVVEVSGRRARHLSDVLQAKVGDSFAVGFVNGSVGRGEVLSLGPGSVTLAVRLDRVPPRPRVSLVLAMVRPQVMKRTLEHLATMGVRRIALVGARRVEKAYFSQRIFDGDAYQEHLRLGLEQAGDTWMPEVSIHRRFRPFVEDVLPGWLEGVATRVVAHPSGASTAVDPVGPDEQVALAVGPEGGWSEHEVERFVSLGFRPVSFGLRVLRVETAIPYLFGKLGL